MKLTEQQLNEKIAELRGWEQTEAGFCGRSRKCWLHPEYRISWDIAPDYTGDMNLVGQLLDELPGAELSKDRFIPDHWEAGFSAESNNITSRRCRGHRSKATAICLAWLQWKTGETVEVEG